MTYLINFCKDKHPDVLKWVSDLAPIKYATKGPSLFLLPFIIRLFVVSPFLINVVEFDGIMTDLSELRRGLVTAQNKTPSVEKGDDKWDVFYRVMPEALEKIQTEFKELEDLSSKISEDFKDLVASYGEKVLSSFSPPSPLPPSLHRAYSSIVPFVPILSSSLARHHQT